mmetsp:Transcript_34338/g.39120  ORF Transcript_34338/g.39120 Transcript_34338/m.39120 type:complete len:521 (+) Transcript_34338:13-1575(+)
MQYYRTQHSALSEQSQRVTDSSTPFDSASLPKYQSIQVIKHFGFNSKPSEMDEIVGVIKHVVSETGDLASTRKNEPEDVMSYIQTLKRAQAKLLSTSSSGPPVVVEMDEPMSVNHSHMTGDEARTSTASSLSDGNEHPYHDQRIGYQSTDSSVSSIYTSKNGSGNWGWFEDVHDSRNSKKLKNRMDPQIIQINSVDPTAMAVTAPTYVLEESLSSQKLWRNTAGNRPPQPVEERAFYEKMWAQNFAKSNVHYGMPSEVLTAASPISLSPFADGNFRTELSNHYIAEDTKKEDPADSIMYRLEGQNKDFGLDQPQNTQYTVVNKKIQGNGTDGSLTVLVRGDNVFGTTVSKSFAKSSKNGGPLQGIDTVNISIASYRVVDSKKYGKYAQYLVIYREGSIRDTIGVWKRYSHFAELSQKVLQQHQSCVSVLANVSPLSMTEDTESEHLPNAITSWRLLKKRQRWYRCLDAGYLSLKVFLLERFLHDILFESTSPNLLREFVGDVVVSDDNSSINSDNSCNRF